MANLILTSIGWEERIRSKMGVDEAYLPDKDLQQPDIIAVAEANIIEQVPNYASLEGAKRIYLEAAAVLECCILVCPSMPARLPVQNVSPHMETKITVDWDKKGDDFKEERNSFIARIIEMPTVPHFGLTR